MDPGILPGSAYWCILGSVSELRYNLEIRPTKGSPKMAVIQYPWLRSVVSLQWLQYLRSLWSQLAGASCAEGDEQCSNTPVIVAADCCEIKYLLYLFGKPLGYHYDCSSNQCCDIKYLQDPLGKPVLYQLVSVHVFVLFVCSAICCQMNFLLHTLYCTSTVFEYLTY